MPNSDNWKTQKVAIALCCLAAFLMIANIILTIPDMIDLKLISIVSSVYIVLFLFILVFSIIIPQKAFVETYKFLEVRYGPSAFVVFVGKL